LFDGVVDMLTRAQSPGTCLWVHGALSCGDDPLRPEFAAQRAAGLAELRKRFRRAKVDGDLPETVDEDALARLVQTLNFGLTLQASTGATRKELLAKLTEFRRAHERLLRGSDFGHSIARLCGRSRTVEVNRPVCAPSGGWPAAAKGKPVPHSARETLRTVSPLFLDRDWHGHVYAATIYQIPPRRSQVSIQKNWPEPPPCRVHVSLPWTTAVSQMKRTWA
jgi:hypothetical protein